MLASQATGDPTPDFHSKLKANAQFAQRLLAQSPHTPVTFGLVAINVLVFLSPLFGKSMGATAEIAWGSDFYPSIAGGEWWRLITSLFIHLGMVHLVCNMVVLAVSGRTIERLYGSVSFLLIYVCSGITGGLVSICWHPTIHSVGASGAIFGIFGALLAAQMHDDGSIPRDMMRPMQNWALAFFCLSAYGAFSMRGIDYAAHVGGLVSGFCVGLAGVRPVTGERVLTRGDLRCLAQIGTVAAMFFAAGVGWVWLTVPAPLSGN